MHGSPPTFLYKLGEAAVAPPGGSSMEFSQAGAKPMWLMPLLALLGASCWLIFRSLSLTGLLLASFLASLSLSYRVLIEFLQFSKPLTPPGTSKIHEKPLVFLCFS